ncbi:MAG: DUF1800 domain-containing protein [Proteobacteria bacterium]|nr:DUF1800 domain-containing protein [Pseudomonadota bacterium]
MASYEATIAANRFGLGARPGDLEKIGPNPKLWLANQLNPGQNLPPELQGLPHSSESVRFFFVAKKMMQQAKKEKDKQRKKMMQRKIRDAFQGEAAAHSLAAAKSDQPFRERLVRFWANHFTVSVRNGKVRPVAYAFEREAIRPHVTGRFSDMLLAVARHPAMLIYLDNQKSIGPNSRAGRRRKKGLNENLAREILELHTMGASRVYTQADVISFAKMLTGWTMEGRKSATPGRFTFRQAIHEPGPKRFLGRILPEAGMREAETAMLMVAIHPETAWHVATKLATHFIADNPNPEAIAHIASAFSKSGGDLRATALAMLQINDAWAPKPAKMKTPAELVISVARALNLDLNMGKGMVRAQNILGQKPYAAPSPAGWPDKAEAWAAPEAMMERLEWGASMAVHSRRDIDPVRFAKSILGPTVSENTLTWISRAPSVREGIALVFASPAFQRR